jgi:carbon storage regulator CsrA
MLVLTRKPQEKIQIGDQITISILRIKGRAVSVGIDAPSNVRVVRGELARTIGTAGLPGGADETSEDRETEGRPSEGPDSEIPISGSFRPQPRLSTRSVNQVLVLRRRARQSSQPPPPGLLVPSLQAP